MDRCRSGRRNTRSGTEQRLQHGPISIEAPSLALSVVPLLALLELNVAHLILADTSASVSELKKDPMGTVAAGEGFPVAILNRNAPVFYCVPAHAYEALLDRLEDLELNAIADARKDQAVIEVAFDAL